MKPPLATQKPYVLKKHGHRRSDPFFWLNDRDNPEVLAHLNRENEYTQNGFKKVKSFENALFDEMVARVAKDDSSVPYRVDHFEYYSKVEGEKEYPIYCRRIISPSSEEECILDVNELAKNKPFYQVDGLVVSPNHNLLVFAEDATGRRLYTLRIKQISTGRFLPTRIRQTSGDACFSACGTYLFYVKKDPTTLREFAVYRHEIGTNSSSDQCVFRERNEAFSLSISKSKSRKWIFLESSSSTSDEVRYLPADKPLSRPRIIFKRRKNVEYMIDHAGDQFFVLHNYQASNFELAATSILTPSIRDLKPLIAHRPEVMLEDFEVFADFLVWVERQAGLTHIQVMDRTTGDSYPIPFHDPAYVVDLEINLDFDQHLLRFEYTSLTTPNTVYQFNMKTREMAVLKRQQVRGDFHPDQYTSERIMIKARDGISVPVSLVYKTAKRVAGQPMPTLLYAYGSYGYSMDPYFSSVRLSLLDRGYIFAIAHVRGGEEMGRSWYEDGKMSSKWNTFNDFIDCASELIHLGYTKPSLLGIMGGSAGGLLMGVVINERPELFNCCIAQVPFVDVVTTMLDDSIPLTTGEYEEWGNPNKRSDFTYMLSYSPYDQVAPKHYPALLVTTGLYDSQVQYWEPAKWVAKLRLNQLSDKPIYLWCDMNAGHGGASGRFERYREIAMEYAFLIQSITPALLDQKAT
ncbi:MAG TPA: S9 family peptidase [Luteibaculaceae bacterium]|nr:S9 family peptidase [Luteibaculaceae bacterium]